MAEVAVGSFVKVVSELGRKLGIGKVADIAGSNATVTYFDVPGDTTPFTIDAHLSALRPVSLAEQTWHFGTMREQGAGSWAHPRRRGF
ncbi:MAG: hypothetical protein IPM40_16445 [Gammaproteobacteria bacterium]|nr:hypothetical protein [Gammaproteobacteria bacterium]